MAINNINGVTYFEAPETDGCHGCVALDDSRLCAKLQQTDGYLNRCEAHEVIWLTTAKAEIKTPSGTFQQAPVEGRGVCSGCVAENNWGLCREICREHPHCMLTPQRIWVRVQPVAPNIPEVLSILQEECAEVIQAVSKVQRFGLDNHHPERTKTNKQELEEELGDLLAMIQILTDQNFLDKASIALATQAKTQKLKQYSTVWTQNKPNN